MKEDYLWDKTGEDPEIEKLENALAVFRCRENAPAIAAKVLPFKRERAPRRVFSIRFAAAAAACIAFAAIAVGVLLQTSANKTENRQELTTAVAPEDKIVSLPESKPEKSVASIAATPDNTITEKVAKTIKAAARNTNSTGKFAPVSYQRLETQTKNSKAAAQKPETRNIRLTKEEQYAYSQLLLALSITSSQLKLVQDKIDGIEKQDAGAKTGGNLIQEK